MNERASPVGIVRGPRMVVVLYGQTLQIFKMLEIWFLIKVK